MSTQFHEGEGEFIFKNGDKYEGHYCAHASGLAWRQGPGVYSTHDGQVYKGNWKDDKLNEAENVEIIFQNRNRYCGKIHKYKYNGPGTYFFRDENRLTSIFENNKPTGDIIYVDRYDRLWYGKAQPECSILNREHVFSSELDEDRGKGQPIHKPKEIKITVIEEEPEKKESMDPREIEKIIFAKSLKTSSDIDFSESEWFKEYQMSEDFRKTTLTKTATSGSFNLTEEEKLWHQNFKKSMKILQDRKGKKTKKSHDLLRQYFEEGLKDTCPPISVFYPRQNSQALDE